MMFLHCFFICLLLRTVFSELVTVNTKDGPVVGTRSKLFSGKYLDSFLGIPYADPPIGNLRFLPPQPLKPWTEPLSVTKLPPSCYQAVPEVFKPSQWFVSDSPESEDCLYLNIWKPSKRNCKLPIMIFVHGGAYVAGSSNLPLYDGSILATEQNVIVASMNYRMSSFGFLCLGNDEVPGNAGLRDQIQAIEWIRDNAEMFGGNKELITLFGHSVGAHSVTGFMAVPKTAELFKYGIAESGSLEMEGFSAPVEKVLNDSFLYAKSVDCTSDDKNEVLECLRSKTPSELLEKYYREGPFALPRFVPVRNGIEFPSDIESVARLTSGNAGKNLIAGGIPSELSFFIPGYIPSAMFSENLALSESDLRALLSNVFGLTSPQSQNQVFRQYGVTPSTGKSLRDEIIQIISDEVVVCPTYNFAKEWSSNNAEVYFYYWTVKPSKYQKQYVPSWAGPIHGDEILFVFGAPLDPKSGYTVKEKQLSEKMMTYWANFARTGNPNVKGMEYWPSTPRDGMFVHLQIGQKIFNKTGFVSDGKCNFWKNVYPCLTSVETQDSERKCSAIIAGN